MAEADSRQKAGQGEADVQAPVLATFDAHVSDSMKLNAIVAFDMALADGPHDLPAVRMMEMMWRVVRQILEHVGVAVDAEGATKFKEENLRI